MDDDWKSILDSVVNVPQPQNDPGSEDDALNVYPLRKTVSTINNDIRSGSITRSITRQVQKCSLQLTRLPLSAHRNLIPPDILRRRRNEIRDLSRDVARRNGVASREPYPFHRQRFACQKLVQGIEKRSKEVRGDIQRCITPAFAALYVACNCGILTICPLILAVATKLPSLNGDSNFTPSIVVCSFFCLRQCVPATLAQ